MTGSCADICDARTGRKGGGDARVDEVADIPVSWMSEPTCSKTICVDVERDRSYLPSQEVKLSIEPVTLI